MNAATGTVPHAEFHPCAGPRPGAAGHVVLLPGWGMSGVVFADLLPALRARAHVTVIDLPGCGSNAGVVARSVEECAAQVADVAPLHAAWLGWSLGGMVAACVAVNEPQRVRALATVATNLSFVQRAGWQPAMPAATFAAFERDVAADCVAAFDRFLALQCQGSATLREDLRRLRALAAVRPGDRDALLAGLALLRDTDLRPLAGELACPSLWLYGAQDALVPATVAEAVARRVPGARTDVLPGVAHVPFLASAPQILSRIESFPEFLA